MVLEEYFARLGLMLNFGRKQRHTCAILARGQHLMVSKSKSQMTYGNSIRQNSITFNHLAAEYSTKITITPTSWQVATAKQYR